MFGLRLLNFEACYSGKHCHPVCFISARNFNTTSILCSKCADMYDLCNTKQQSNCETLQNNWNSLLKHSLVQSCNKCCFQSKVKIKSNFTFRIVSETLNLCISQNAEQTTRGKKVFMFRPCCQFHVHICHSSWDMAIFAYILFSFTRNW